jgi:CHAD domain-containing protein
VKPGFVELDAAAEPLDVLRTVTGVRLAEAVALAYAFRDGSPAALHQFRIACKRLRYGLERLAVLAPPLEAAAATFSHLQDALGEARDCDLLLAALPPTMPKTRTRLLEDRLTNVLHAARLWNDAVVLLGETLRFVDESRAGAREAADKQAHV